MGYYTNYNLTYKLPENYTKEQKLILCDAFNQKDACEYGPLDDFLSGQSDECKWYNHEEDMLNFSKRFPEVVFILEGSGEEQGDQWFKYFKNGKIQRCNAIITFEKYDESLLE